jgi:uncharacterized Zn-binding protein involved in type VI secretion
MRNSIRKYWAILLCAAAAITLMSSGHAGAGEVGPPGAAAGSESVLINGRPAQRLGDQAGGEDGAPGDASSNVLINGKPAAVGGRCPNGAAPTPSPNVFINGKAALLCN